MSKSSQFHFYFSLVFFIFFIFVSFYCRNVSNPIWTTPNSVTWWSEFVLSAICDHAILDHDNHHVSNMGFWSQRWYVYVSLQEGVTRRGSLKIGLYTCFQFVPKWALKFAQCAINLDFNGNFLKVHSGPWFQLWLFHYRPGHPNWEYTMWKFQYFSAT